MFERPSVRKAREEIGHQAWIAGVRIERAREDHDAALDKLDIHGAYVAGEEIRFQESILQQVEGLDPRKVAADIREREYVERARHSMYDTPKK